MEGGAPYNPRTLEEVFRDFKGRRAGMIKALTTDVEEFYQQCDPEKENLCLYGFPSEQWEVNLPAEEVPPELPEPALGINFARDGMEEKDWLSLVAVHSDAWLLAVASYFGARFGFDKADRKRLFNMINDLPTIFEVVTGTAKKQAQGKEKSSVSNHSSNKSKSNSKRGSESQGKYSKAMQSKDEDEEGLEEEDEDEHGETLCGACGENYAADEFWICCDICEKWFHGKCVKITPARAEHIKQYKCPSCSKDAIILFSGWPKHSLGMYILALLLVFFVAMAAEILSIQRYRPVKRGTNQHSLGMYILALLLVFFLAMAAEILSIQRYRPVKRGTNPVAEGITQAAIYAIRMGFLYLVMLAVMSFNLGIFIAAIVGHTLGFFVVESRAVAVANKENKDELPYSTIIPASNI